MTPVPARSGRAPAGETKWMVDEPEAAEALPAVHGDSSGSGRSGGLNGTGAVSPGMVSLGVRSEVRFASRIHTRGLVPLGSLAGSSYMHARAGALVVGRRWMLRHCHGVHSWEVLRAVQGYHVVLGPQRCWTAPGQRGYLSVTMSMLTSRLDRASESFRANRSANLRLLEELDEQLHRAGPVGASAVCLPPVLGIALSACHSGEVKGTDGFGVFRM